MRTSPVSISLAAAALVAAICGCGRPVNRAAERRIRDALPQLLGSARSYRVHVSGEPLSTVRGRLQHVAIDGDDVSLRNGLLLDRLNLELSGVDVDTARGRVQSIQSATFTAVMGEVALDEFMAGEAPEGETIRAARVKLGPGQEVTLSAERVTLGIGIPFSLRGPLRLAGPERLQLDPDRMTVVGVPITGRVLQFIKRRFESAIDLSTLPFPIGLTSVRVSPGMLTLTGTADAGAILSAAAHD